MSAPEIVRRQGTRGKKLASLCFNLNQPQPNLKIRPLNLTFKNLKTVTVLFKIEPYLIKYRLVIIGW